MTSSNDTFSSTVAATNNNLTRLSKTVASTAASLMTSSYGDLQHTHYQTAMNDIARRPAFQKRLFSFNSRRAPSEVVKSSLSRSEIQYRVMTSIPEELLHDIPSDSSNRFSLFQGFRASIEEEERDELGDETIKSSSKLLEDGKSLKQKKKPLSIQKDDIIHRLDILEIRKDLAAAEIIEIDQRIEHLNSMRRIVFERVAELEQQELKLETELQQISDKISEQAIRKKSESEELKNRGKKSSSPTPSAISISASSPSSSNGGRGSDEFATITTSTDDSGWSDLAIPSSSSPSNIERNEETIIDDDTIGGLMSQSIYGKLQETSSKAKNHQPKNYIKRRHSTSRRKTMPTLQQFYSPGKNIRTIEAHKDSITALDFDIPFGTMVSASVDDDSVTVWDLSRGEVIRKLTGHKAYIKCLQLDNNILATGSADATVKLWDLSNADDEQEESGGQEHSCFVESFEAHLGEISALHFYGNTLVTGSADKTIRQWDLQTGRCLQTLDVLWAAAQSATGGGGGGFGGFEDPRWKRKSRIPGGIKTTSSPNIGIGGSSNDFDFVGALQSFDAALATGTADGVVRLWDLRTGQVHRSLLGHTGPVTCLQFDDVHLATGSLDRSIRIWDLRTGTIFDAFAYNSPITSLHFDVRRIVSANSENTVKIYDREVEKHWTCGAGEDDANAAIVNCVRYREGYLIEGREDGRVGVWAC